MIRQSRSTHFPRASWALVPALALLALAHRAVAAPEEIQVYEDDMDKPGQFGLDVHNSYVWGRPSALQYPGEQQPDDRYRITPEWSYGLTQNIELGLYLPLAEIDRGLHDRLEQHARFETQACCSSCLIEYRFLPKTGSRFSARCSNRL